MALFFFPWGGADRLLQAISDLRPLESLKPNSRTNYVSGLQAWSLFCDLKEIPKPAQLDIAEELAAQGLSLSLSLSLLRAR